MTNDQLINEAIAILQTMNMEDCAQAIDNLLHELERVKGIAGRRLDRIAQLQHDVAVLEDKLEDTRSELKYAKKELEEEEELEDHGGLWGAHCRGELA